MSKAELIRRVAEANPELANVTCKAIVDVFFDTMSEHLSHSGRIELRGFATFFVAAPIGGRKHNPRTGEPVGEASQPRVRFRPTSKLAEAIASS